MPGRPLHTRPYLVCLSSLLVACLSAQGQVLVQTTAQMSAARSRPAVAFVDGKAFVIDGVITYQTGGGSDIVDVYDVNTWQRTGGLTTPHGTSTPGAAVVGSKVLVATDGYMDIYDDSTGSWASSPFPTRVWMGSAAAAAGGKAFFGGGDYAGTTRVDVYDGATGLWSIDALSVGRTSLAAAAVGSQVLFAGGYVGDSSRIRSDVVDIYDTDTMHWTTAHLSQPRSHLTATTVGDLAFFAGGSYVNGSDSTGSNVVDIYDSSTGEWSVTHMPHARTVLAAGAVGNKALFAGGGYYQGLDYLDIYDIETGTWTSMTLSRPRGWLGGGTDGLHSVFAGGRDSDYLRNTVDIVTPEPASLSLLAVAGLWIASRRRRSPRT